MDYDKELERDIKRFERTGKLPEDYDVKPTSKKSKSSPYWDHVSRNLNGREPLFNSGEIPVEEDDLPSTDKARLFREWLESDFPKLPEEDQELFRMVWEKQIAIPNVAKYFNVKPVTIYKRVERLKSRIASWVGINM